jgi:heat shock protein HtpX
MTLYTQASKNVRRTWLLFSLFFIFIVALGWLFSAIYNSPAILYGAVILSLLLNWVSYWYSDKLALTIAGARPASREEFFDLYTTVENLAITAGLPLPKIYIIPDSAPNAFATGRDKEHAVVAVTSGLLYLFSTRSSTKEAVCPHSPLQP